MRFVMLDDDGGSTEEIGYFETTLGNIMGSRNQTVTAELKIDSSQQGKRGQIMVRAEAVQQSNHTIVYQISGTELPNIEGGCLGMCSSVVGVHYEIEREIGSGSGHFATAYKSIKAHGTTNPLWTVHKIRMSKLSGGNPNTRLRIRFVVGENKEIGYIMTSPSELSSKRIF